MTDISSSRGQPSIKRLCRISKELEIRINHKIKEICLQTRSMNKIPRMTPRTSSWPDWKKSALEICSKSFTIWIFQEYWGSLDTSPLKAMKGSFCIRTTRIKCKKKVVARCLLEVLLSLTSNLVATASTSREDHQTSIWMSSKKMFTQWDKALYQDCKIQWP